MENTKVHLNGTYTADRRVRWPFWLQLVLAAVIPIVMWWSVTPTNVLNSSALWKLLETVGIGGSVMVFFFGIPTGIVGIIAAKRTDKLRIATVALSIVNLCAGIVEVGILILLLCAVLFGGASV